MIILYCCVVFIRWFGKEIPYTYLWKISEYCKRGNEISVYPVEHPKEVHSIRRFNGFREAWVLIRIATVIWQESSYCIIILIVFISKFTWHVNEITIATKRICIPYYFHLPSMVIFFNNYKKCNLLIYSGGAIVGKERCLLLFLYGMGSDFTGCFRHYG